MRAKILPKIINGAIIFLIIMIYFEWEYIEEQENGASGEWSFTHRRKMSKNKAVDENALYFQRENR